MIKEEKPDDATGVENAAATNSESDSVAEAASSAAEPVAGDAATAEAPTTEEATTEPSAAESTSASPTADEAAPSNNEEAEENSGAETAAGNAPAAATAALEAEVATLRDKLIRLQADFDNYRKRQARDRADWIAQANADLLEDLLPALDQTDLALAAAQKESSEAAKPFLDGFSLVRRTLLGSLAKHGLKPVEDTVGKPLDTATSEAVTVMRTGQAKPGCVVYETRKGYTLNGKVLRAAQVVVEDDADDAGAASSPDSSEAADQAPAPGETVEG